MLKESKYTKIFEITDKCVIFTQSCVYILKGWGMDWNACANRQLCVALLVGARCRCVTLSDLIWVSATSNWWRDRDRMALADCLKIKIRYKETKWVKLIETEYNAVVDIGKYCVHNIIRLGQPFVLYDFAMFACNWVHFIIVFHLPALPFYG